MTVQSTTCPACAKPLPVKGLYLHVSKCSQWESKMGIPVSEFCFEEYNQTGLFAPQYQENVDYVVCRVCKDAGKQVRQKRLMDHLTKQHALTEQTYLAKYPDASVRVAGTLQKRIDTVRERFGTENVFQATEVKEKSKQTSLDRYGVEHANQAPQVQKDRAQTNLERYGAENVFGSKEIQDKLRETNLERYGVENPNQNPEIIAKRLQTNLEKYGAEHYLLTPEFREKVRATCKQRYGTEHFMQNPYWMQTQYVPVIRLKYGVDSVLSIKAVQDKAYETNLANHGGKHSQQCPEVREKARQTWLAKYGTDNPSKLEEIRQKIKQVWLDKYGVPFPPQSVHHIFTSPNKLEQRVDKMLPDRVLYTGDSTYWVKGLSTARTRNPDFVILTDAQHIEYCFGTPLNKLRVGKVLEIFGSYWHGPKITGQSREEHTKECLDFYHEVGIACLIVWEDEIEENPQGTLDKILAWVS